MKKTIVLIFTLICLVIKFEMQAQRRVNEPLCEVPEQYKSYFPDYDDLLDKVAPKVTDDYEYFEEMIPSGETYNMRTSIVTLGYRDGLLQPRVPYQPGETVEVEIVALPMLWTVKAGNRLRLDIKSSQFPEYAVHSNYAGGWAEQSITKIAHQEVMTGGPCGARIIIPIIEH